MAEDRCVICREIVIPDDEHDSFTNAHGITFCNICWKILAEQCQACGIDPNQIEDIRVEKEDLVLKVPKRRIH